MNSSLYYVYLVTHFDFHHHNWAYIKPFPIPDIDDIQNEEGEITELADTLWDEMEDHFDPDAGLTGEFNMRPQKLLVNQVDEMLQNLYDLTNEEVEFLKNYLTDCGGNKGRIEPQNEDVTSYEYKNAEAVAED